MTIAIDRAVVNGAAMLDIHRPGWMDKINLDKLDMDKTYGCILGQVFGDYSTGKKVLNIDEHAVHGFAYDYEAAWPNDNLGGQWREYIINRRRNEALQSIPEPAPKTVQISLTKADMEKMVALLDNDMLKSYTIEIGPVELVVTR